MARNPSTWEGIELCNGRYCSLEKLGEGGMGYVYKAFDTERNCHVVIKVPNEMVLQNEGHRKRFEREYRALRELSHPNVVTIYEAREARQLGNIPYAVMQYLAGGDLSGRLSNDPAKLRDWLPAIAEALDYVHQHQHIHRDVKPGNILFDAEGKAYLSDFGIIKIAHDAQNQKTNLTGTGMFIGTPDYMAPEIHDGETVGGPVDQYALAVIVYEALAGKLPFNGKTPIAIAFAHKTERAAQIGGIHPDIEAAIMRGLAKDPAERFPNCSEFAATILATIPAEINDKSLSRQSRNPQVTSLPQTGHSCGCGRLVTMPPHLSDKYLGCPRCHPGPCYTWDDNGKKAWEGYYKNGELDGPRTEWDENGKKRWETHFKDDMPGLVTYWYENGKKAWEGYYKNGELPFLLDGLETQWYENGQKEWEYHYKNGGREGLATKWYENGQKKSEGHWKNSKEDGLETQWHENGQKSAEAHYKNGELDGPRTEWHENGQKSAEAHYKNGELDSFVLGL